MTYMFCLYTLLVFLESIYIFFKSFFLNIYHNKYIYYHKLFKVKLMFSISKHFS